MIYTIYSRRCRCGDGAGPRRCSFVEPVCLWCVGGGPPAVFCLRGPCRNYRDPVKWSISKIPTARMDLAGRTIDAGRGGAIAAFAPQSAGSRPDIADCLEIRTCVLLRPSLSHATLVRTVRIAAFKGAAADCKPNMAKFEPGIAAGCRCHLPIGNCQVLCTFMYMWIEASAQCHAGRGLGGGACAC